MGGILVKLYYTRTSYSNAVYMVQNDLWMVNVFPLMLASNSKATDDVSRLQCNRSQRCVLRTGLSVTTPPRFLLGWLGRARAAPSPRIGGILLSVAGVDASLEGSAWSAASLVVKTTLSNIYPLRATSTIEHTGSIRACIRSMRVGGNACWPREQ